MTVDQRGIVALLRSAVTQMPHPVQQEFDLEQVYPLIKQHHITALAYEGAAHCGFSAEMPVMKKLFADYCKSLMVSERQINQVERVCRTFDENRIDYMPLKGCNMKSRYPKPELRAMGDADILIRLEQYDKIRELMENLGFAEQYDTDHELVWRNSSLSVELHKRLIPSYNVDLYAYFGDGWELAKVKQGSCYAMTAEDEWIYLFTHFAKHYRDGGIGCRHVVDLWVYLRTYPDLNEGYVVEELEKLKLLEFYKNIRRLIDAWFEQTQEDAVVEHMTEFIFASGSWGKIESRALSRAVRDAKHSALGKNGKLLYLWQTAFPSVDVLKSKYTILKKAPGLLPAVWLVRPFYKVLFERDSLARHEKNLEELTQDNMEIRQQMLRFVGLDYNF